MNWKIVCLDLSGQSVLLMRKSFSSTILSIEFLAQPPGGLMLSLHERFSGLFIPHVTPFDQSGAIDLVSLNRLTAYLASCPGVAGLVSCARIGEGPVLSI